MDYMIHLIGSFFTFSIVIFVVNSFLCIKITYFLNSKLISNRRLMYHFNEIRNVEKRLLFIDLLVYIIIFSIILCIVNYPFNNSKIIYTFAGFFMTSVIVLLKIENSLLSYKYKLLSKK